MSSTIRNAKQSVSIQDTAAERRYCFEDSLDAAIVRFEPKVECLKLAG